MTMVRGLLAVLMLLCAAPALATPRDAALGAAVRDMCHRDVALLGEAYHGDGTTIAFKVDLVRALVDRCHFNAIFFEASHYDFLEIARRLRDREPVTTQMVSSSIGMIWNLDLEMRPLFPFLLERARSGRLVLGGLDDQVSSAGAFYSNDTMPVELASYLPPARREGCADLLHRRIYFAYDDTHPRQAARPLTRQCLAEIGQAIRRARLVPTRRAELIEMVASFDRLLTHDGLDGAGYVQGRDRSMYLNFEWLAHRLPPRSKIIVWAATVHVARVASMTPDLAGGRNFGSFIHEAYGPRAFVLGLTAASGASRLSARGTELETLSVAAPDSLEASALAAANGDCVYLSPADLARLGTVRGAFFNHRPLMARWSDVIDGAIVFREEHPTGRQPTGG